MPQNQLIVKSQQLMALPSVTPEQAGTLDLLESWLKPLGFTCYRKKYAEVDNLYAVLNEGAAKNLCFAGHVDVVPAGNLKNWNTDPFTPTIKDGRLFGRGASDMKTAITAWVQALEDYLANNTTNNGLSLLITADEEGPGINGTKKVLEWLKEEGKSPTACIVGEPTNPIKMGEMIKVGRRGSINVFCTSNGVQGHVAYPHYAKNPVTKLVSFLNHMQQLKLDEGSEFFQPSNLEVVNVNVGNEVTNVIPSSATANFNIRFNDKHSGASLSALIEQAAKEHDIECKYIISGESFLNKDEKLSQLVANSVKTVTGQMPELSTTGGTSDARFIHNYFPVVECGLINETAHKSNENVTLEAIEQAKDIYLEIIKGF